LASAPNVSGRDLVLEERPARVVHDAHFSWSRDLEGLVAANALTTIVVLEIAMAAPVNRLSIGVQPATRPMR
jgi:hypothetical protein